MSKFKFDPAQVVPQAQVEVDSLPSIPSAPRSDAERITDARATCQQIHRTNNSVTNTYGLHLRPEFYKDSGHGSCWLAMHISHLAQLIQTRVAGQLVPIGQDHTFDPRNGIFDCPGYTLFDLTVAYKQRINELGISEARLEEWAARLSSWQEDHAFYNLSFEEKMAKFKEPR
jgi:hypothetical protein